MVRLLPAIAFLFAGGCAIVDNEVSDGLPGYVSFGFEDSSFYPCNSSERWWLNEPSSLGIDERYDAIASNPYEHVYARLRGSRSPRGKYGHLGAYQREFTVSEVVEMRKPAEGDCTWKGPQLQ